MSEALLKTLHVRCERDDDGKLKGLSFDRASQTYRSGWWNLLETEAESLVGGWLYVHHVGVAAAEIGGRILSFELTQVTARGNENRVVFAFDYQADARNVVWRGANLAGKAAGLGGLVDAGLPHETSITSTAGGL